MGYNKIATNIGMLELQNVIEAILSGDAPTLSSVNYETYTERHVFFQGVEYRVNQECDVIVAVHRK